MGKPFHRLLAFYSSRSPHSNAQTIHLMDSLRGNLALGLDFPVALIVALGRRLFLRNTGFFSLSIHIPKVSTEKTLLDGVPINEKHNYSCSKIVSLAKKKNGWAGAGDALGLWALAADVRTGLLSLLERGGYISFPGWHAT
ncbi:uncharacterized protein K441DRAFT_557293 [Cenococcum geophilum 1.58]|uniref:uncharacterized protein n=1 Tax=Cenococcum geophilum 1.58 TaxID=794803 RepID=UPI00358F3776|nr:hypothetical protein K441DRAFT_557293 [Cenococcum geophilum 1.58]